MSVYVFKSVYLTNLLWLFLRNCIVKPLKAERHSKLQQVLASLFFEAGDLCMEHETGILRCHGSLARINFQAGKVDGSVALFDMTRRIP